jgi:hypothetical protein
MDNDLNQRIQERAYEIWEQEGRSGDPEDHWFRAEQELRDPTCTKRENTAETKPAEDKIIDKLGDFA